MEHPETMKVKPWGEGQGAFVVINRADFDARIHAPFAGEDAPDAAPLAIFPPAEPLTPTPGFEVVPPVSPPDLDGDGNPGGSLPHPAPVDANGDGLPENWQALHHKTREALAVKLGAKAPEGGKLTSAAVTAFLEAFEAEAKAARGE